MDIYPEFVGVVAVPLHCPCGVELSGVNARLRGGSRYCRACAKFLLDVSIERILLGRAERVLLHR